MMRVLLCLTGLFAFSAAHTCQPLWTSGPFGCYRVFTGLAKTWMEARQHCQSFSSCGPEGGVGDLAVVPDAQVNDFIQLLREMSILTNPGPSVWLGGTDGGSEGRWRWANGKAAFQNYMNWAPGQPDNAGSGEHCMRFPSDRTTNMWDDFDCNTQLPYVCQHFQPPRQPQNPQQPGQGGRPQFMYGRPNPSQIGGHY